MKTERKIASVKISENLLNKLKDAQYGERKGGGQESTYADILDDAWSFYEQSSPSQDVEFQKRASARLQKPVPVPLSHHTKISSGPTHLAGDIPTEAFLSFPEAIRETVKKCVKVLMSRHPKYGDALAYNADTFADGVDARDLLAALADGATAPVSPPDGAGTREALALVRKAQSRTDRATARAVSAGKERGGTGDPDPQITTRPKQGHT